MQFFPRLAIVSCLGLFGWSVSCDVAFSQPLVLPAAPAGVEVFRQQGTEFSHVYAPAVSALAVGGNINRMIGGGNWNFGMARTELTQGQWIEMVNAFNATAVPSGQSWSSAVDITLKGTRWLGPGVFGDYVGPQGRFYFATDAVGSLLPTRGAGWFGAAMYCNWLHNGKGSTISSLLNGAYDLRSWNDSDSSTWPSVNRQPGATYWIPTYEEWAVASYLELNYLGGGASKWWTFLNRRDRLPISGPPGLGETSAGWDGFDLVNVPVASYPESQSPWGLLDTSGSYSEWVEDQWPFGDDRLTAGTRGGEFSFPDSQWKRESPGWIGTESPNSGPLVTFRIATSIPSPSSFAPCALFALVNIRRRQCR